MFNPETFYSIGKEAIIWTPIAIGYITDDPTLYAIGEISSAAINLYEVYKSETPFERFSSAAAAAVSLIGPFSYHPKLSAQISEGLKSRVFMILSGNNLIRGISQIKKIAKIMIKDEEVGVVVSINEKSERLFSLGVGISKVGTGILQLKKVASMPRL